jgi:DNA gyrase/topoisomerase IV subunit B
MDAIGSAAADLPLGPAEVVAEFIALSVVESTYTPGLTLTVEIVGCTATLTDTGRGMQLAPDDGDDIPHAQRVLTSPYPISSASARVDEVLTRLVWGAAGSLGPARATRHCPELSYTSRRDGQEWTQRFVHGEPTGPPRELGPTDLEGTSIQLTTAWPIDPHDVRQLVERLTHHIDGLDIVVRAG